MTVTIRDCDPSPGSNRTIARSASDCRCELVSPESPSLSGTPSQALAASRGVRHSGVPLCNSCSRSSRASSMLVTRSIIDLAESDETSIAPRLFGRRPTGSKPHLVEFASSYAASASVTSSRCVAARRASSNSLSSIFVLVPIEGTQCMKNSLGSQVIQQWMLLYEKK